MFVMKYQNEVSVKSTGSQQSFVARNPTLQATEIALQSINFYQSLQHLPHIVSLDRQELSERAQEIISSTTWQQHNHAIVLEPARVEEFVMQRLSRQFFITERFTAFAAAQLPYIQERSVSLEERMHNLSANQLDLVDRVAKYCPLSAGITAAFFAEDLQPRSKQNELDQIAVKTALAHKQTLEVAFEAMVAVEDFIAELACRTGKPLSPNSTRLIEAWREDLILPLVEATIFTVAAGITALEKGFDAGASWYVSRISLPENPSEAKNFYSNWRDVCRGDGIIARSVLYEGIDLEYKGEKRRVLKDGTVPVPLIIGAHDSIKFFNWYRDVFQALQDSIDVSEDLKPQKFKHGCLARFDDGSQIFLRGKAEAQGQARIGITTPQAYGQISMRLDLEGQHLTLDFGALSPADMFGCQKNLIRLNRKNNELYRKLRTPQTNREVKDTKLMREAVKKHERLNQLSKKIGHFSYDNHEAMKQMPTFIAALSGVGRSLAIRSNETIGHHALESLYRLSRSDTRLKQNFAESVKELTEGLLNVNI
jgi:hypothetical protein